jgi:hypothetical protein
MSSEIAYENDTSQKESRRVGMKEMERREELQEDEVETAPIYRG